MTRHFSHSMKPFSRLATAGMNTGLQFGRRPFVPNCGRPQVLANRDRQQYRRRATAPLCVRYPAYSRLKFSANCRLILGTLVRVQDRVLRGASKRSAGPSQA